MIKFNNISSGTLGCYVEHYPPRPVPQRKVEVYSVPGRSGDVIDEQDAWENVEQVYDVYLSAEQAGLPAVAAAVVRWLSEPRGYARLEDDYDPDVFRMAAFTDGAELKNTLNAFGRGSVKFNCRPQRFLKAGETPIVPVQGTYTGPIVAFDAPATITGFNVRCEVNAKQAGSGDPSPENIRAISGWTGAKVTRCGKNLAVFAAGAVYSFQRCTQEYKNGGVVVTSTGSYGRCGYSFSIKAGQTYVCSFKAKRTGPTESLYVSSAVRWTNYDIWVTSLTTTLTQYSFSFTATSDMLFFSIYPSNNGSSVTLEDFQLELGSSRTEYEEYTGSDFVVDWQSDAGTVYGGELDLTGGELTVTHGYIASYAGETLPGAWISDRDVYAPGTTPTTGAQVVYEMAAPLVYQLTAQDVTALADLNTVWASTGDVTVSYGGTSMTLTNPTGYSAEPLITVSGAGSGSVTIGSVTVTISSITDGMVLDCAEGEAYAESGGVVTNLNSVVSGGFPVLGAGETVASWAGGVTAVEIIPRWWEL